MKTPKPNNSTAPDSGQPRSLTSMETLSCCPLQVSLIRSGRLGLRESQRNTAHARLAEENVRLNMRWS